MLRRSLIRPQHFASIITRSTYAPARFMATPRSSLAHEARTASEPRENRLESVIVAHIQEINENIRVFRLNAEDPNRSIKFLPGQWLDTWIPGLPQAGGFTITSTPSEARPTNNSPPFLELAVQKSSNPPAQWLWQAADKIMGSQLRVRVGGSFTWPPPSLDPSAIDRLVLIAGGVGINPLISILAHLVRSGNRPREIHFVYTTKAGATPDPHRILFLPRLLELISTAGDANVTLALFLTKLRDHKDFVHEDLPRRTFARRPTKDDLLQALDGYAPGTSTHPTDRRRTVCYVCGPPAMTDEIVSLLSHQQDMSTERVLCEKWW